MFVCDASEDLEKFRFHRGNPGRGAGRDSNFSSRRTPAGGHGQRAEGGEYCSARYGTPTGERRGQRAKGPALCRPSPIVLRSTIRLLSPAAAVRRLRPPLQVRWRWGHAPRGSAIWMRWAAQGAVRVPVRGPVRGAGSVGTAKLRLPTLSCAPP
jgi:hypothetical protein